MLSKIQKFIREKRKIIPRFLGGTRLSDNDIAQAHIMGMALASLKSGETNARLIIQQAETMREMQNVISKMLTNETILANYTLVANQAKSMLDNYEDGSIEREAFKVMSIELFSMAENMQKLMQKNQDKPRHPDDFN